MTHEICSPRWRPFFLTSFNRSRGAGLRPPLGSATVMYLVGVNFSLRGGVKHKRLRRPRCNLQIVLHTHSDGHKCLKFTDNAQSKRNQGGLLWKFKPPEVVHVHPNANTQRCLVRLYEKYVNLMPEKTTAKFSFSDQRQTNSQGMVGRSSFRHK